MKAKAAGVLALATLIAGVGLAGTLRAQEKGDAEGLVRVLAFGQGSYLGVYIADVTGEDVDRLGLREERGVLITGVADEGPARDAGLPAIASKAKCSFAGSWARLRPAARRLWGSFGEERSDP